MPRRAICPCTRCTATAEDALSPSAEQLAGLDAVVIDLQDVGARYYTFVWTAVLVLRAAARSGIEAVVLDRPNPLGGEIVEGAPAAAWLSLVRRLVRCRGAPRHDHR